MQLQKKKRDDKCVQAGIRQRTYPFKSNRRGLVRITATFQSFSYIDRNTIVSEAIAFHSKDFLTHISSMPVIPPTGLLSRSYRSMALSIHIFSSRILIIMDRKYDFLRRKSGD